MSNVGLLPTADLFNREGSSDKVYQLSIEAAGDGFVVRFANGRRGSKLRVGTKTSVPVTFAVAKALFDSIVNEKTANGYRAVAGGATTVELPNAVAAVLPHGITVPPRQQLNAATEAEAATFIASDEYCAQPKFDGECVTIVRRGAHVVGFNKLKKPVALAPAVEAAFLAATRDMTLDAEAYSDRVVVYDCTYLDDDRTGDTTHQRLGALAEAMLALGATQTAVFCTDTAITTAHKTALVAALRADGKEGVVFKQLRAAYSDGRPASGGPMRKLKFWKSATVRVASVHPTKRSVGFEVCDAATGAWVGVGNVTVKVNQAIPAIGARIEVQYL